MTKSVYLPEDSRRVAGLRRSEVAASAGLSIEYYTRIEGGEPAQCARNVSPSSGSWAASEDADAKDVVNDPDHDARTRRSS